MRVVRGLINCQLKSGGAFLRVPSWQSCLHPELAKDAFQTNLFGPSGDPLATAATGAVEDHIPAERERYDMLAAEIAFARSAIDALAYRRVNTRRRGDYHRRRL
jgi:hypothetical protein